MNADDYCCHPPPPSPRFDCCVSLCPHRLTFVHRRHHWKTPPPTNAPAHRPVLHHMATHSQLHLTSGCVGMMWGFLKRDPIRRCTAVAQSTGSLLAYVMRIQPPECPRRAIAGCGNASPPPQWGSTRGGGPPRPPRSLLRSRWFHIPRGYSRGSSPVCKIPPGSGMVVAAD
jgi:hypothetical protein